MKKRWILILVLALSTINGRGQPLRLHPANAQISVSAQLNRGLTQYQAGQYEQAIALWQSLLNDSQVKGDRLRLGQLWNYISLSEQKLEQWDNASQSILQSLRYLTPSSQGHMTRVHQQYYAQALTTQGQLYLERGNETAAVETWQKSEQIYRRLGDDLGLRGSLINQALALEAGGFYRRACLTVLEAVQIENRCNFAEETDASKRHILTTFAQSGDPGFQAIALHTFSKILLQLGELDFASTAIQTAQARQSTSQIQPSLDFTASSIAFAQYRALKQEESRTRSRRLAQQLQQQVMQQATQTQQQYEQLLSDLQPSNRFTYYQAQVDYLTFLVDYTPWLQTKQRQADSVLPILRRQIEQLQAQPISTTSHLAVHYAHIKQAEGLIELFKQDSTQYAFVQPHILALLQQVIQSAPTSSPLPQSAGGDFAKAFAYGALGHFAEIKQQWPQAEQWTQRALSQSQAVQNAEVAYRWQWQLGRILGAQGQRDRAIQAYEQALIALESIRKDLLSLKRDAQFSFRDQVEPSYRQLVALLLSDANPDNVSLSSARQVIDRLQVSEVEDFLLQNCIQASLASLDAYIERQASQSALIYTIIQDQHIDVIVKIPNTNQIQFHRVNQSKAQFENFLNTYRRSLQQQLPSAQRQSQIQGQQLYQWLIQPFQADFQRQHIDTLIFVLDGSLRDIPMATLHTGQQYLIEEYAVAVTPGLQVLEANQDTPTTQQALIAGASNGNSRLGLSPLPAVKQEIQQIASTLPQTNILLNDAFSKASFQESIQRHRAPIIHIATHGQFSSDPDETFIVTGTGERLDLTDLGQLLRQRSQSQSQVLELLFLSACQTLAGDRWAALGMAGVAIRSGAQSTIASIWNANDQASAELVSRFYHHLTSKPGRTKAEALRLAQVEMLNNPRYELPVYWSPYVLIGNWQ